MHTISVYTFGILLQRCRMQISRSKFVLRFLGLFESSRQVWLFLNFLLILHLILVGVPMFFVFWELDDLNGIEELRQFKEANPSLLLIPQARKNMYSVMFLTMACISIGGKFFKEFWGHLLEMAKKKKKIRKKAKKQKSKKFPKKQKF
jgi:hypothetical protein